MDGTAMTVCKWVIFRGFSGDFAPKIIGKDKIDRSSVGCSCFFGKSHHAILVDKSPSAVYTCVHHVEILEVMRNMKPRLFLTGPSGCGKSTMIRRELGESVRRAGGFATVRDRDENGRIRGFEILSADGYGPRDRFLDLTGVEPWIDLEIFDRVGANYLHRAEERSFAVLDEIGGVELLNEAFMDELARYLRSSHPCIGVMKSAGSAGKLVEMMGLTVRYELARRALYEHLRSDPNTCLVECSERNDPTAVQAVRDWVAEYVR